MSKLDNARESGSLAASSPFNNNEADFVIRTSDNIEFGVFKVILRLSSRFFTDMFKTAQPDDADYSKHFPGVPTVEVTEDSLTIDRLLRFCYPYPYADPHLATFGDVNSIIEVAQKYDMPQVLGQVATQLLSTRFLEKDPVRVFAIAARYRLEELARISAKHTLKYPLLGSWVPELHSVPTVVYHALLEYHKKCGEVASIVSVSPYLWTDHEQAGLGCRSNCGDSILRATRVEVGYNSQRTSASSWWVDSMKSIGLQLKDRPCGTTVLDSHLFEENLAASACPKGCIGKGLLKMGKFKELFAQAVDQATGQVVLDIEL